jgi:HPt (histidine-containing phosphotransfer) domain-containing protein
MELKKTYHIDLSYLENTFSGNKEIINKVLESFLESTPQLVLNLSYNIKNKNWNEVKMLAHMIKSSFHTIGAKSVGDILEELELSLRNSISLLNQINLLSQQVFNEIECGLNK